MCGQEGLHDEATKAHAEQVIRKLARGRQTVGRRQRRRRGRPPSRDLEQTYHRWRNQYGGMKADDAKKLKELERENAPAEEDGGRGGARQGDAQGDDRGKLVTPNQRRRVAGMLMERFGVSQRQSVSGHRPGPLHPTAPATGPRRRRGTAPGVATRLLGRRPRWGWRRAADALRQRGLEGQQQADPPPVARRGPARRALASARSRYAGRRARRRVLSDPTQRRCGHSTSSSTRPPTRGC